MMMGQNIRIRPFETLAVLDYESVQEPNRHGRAVITALISSEKEAEYRNTVRNTTWVEVSAATETGEEITLFYGALIRMILKKEPHECVMKLELATGTIFLEREAHTRSFQSESLTYKDAITACNSEYQDAATIMTEGKDERLPHFILQYRENDWDFLRRLCALKDSVLVPSCTVKGIKYFFGMPKLNETAEFPTDRYTLINGTIQSYAVESRDIYFVGTKTEFLGGGCFIWKAETKLKGNELSHTYYLSRDIKNLVKKQDRYNEAITGASLLGTIKKVQDERVRITLKEDENKENTGERWFSFSTVYSSSEGAGWYCMPEPGDQIRLCLPSPDEAEAYVASAVHENQGDGVRTNPDYKIWRNKYGKEIRLTPEKILLTNNKGTSVELTDGQGVRIKSSGSVSMTAGGRIQISSDQGGIEMSASSRIRIQQGEAELLMQDGLQVTGTKVNIM